MRKYKLTDENMQTHGGFQWVLGVEREACGDGTELCSGDVLHFYDSPAIAATMNPTHANIESPRCFAVECDQVAHDGLKGGAKKMTLVEEIPMPELSAEQLKEISIRCAMLVYADPAWVEWAEKWLSGEDRTSTSAARAASAANAAWFASAANAAWFASAANAASAAMAAMAASAAMAAMAARDALDGEFAEKFNEIVEQVIGE